MAFTSRKYERSRDYSVESILIGSARTGGSRRANQPVVLQDNGVTRWNGISIYEDLFRNFMTCQISVLDQDGGFLDILRGEEIIAIKFRTPDLPGYKFKTRTHYFYLYKISPVIPIAKTLGAQYVIHGISMEYFYNVLTTFSKAYTGKTEEIAKKIYDEFLESKFNADSKKKFNIGLQTKNDMKFTFPYVNPVDAINHLASVSIRKDNPDVCNYVFFENSDGYNFKSLTELIESPRKQHKYTTTHVMTSSFMNFSEHFNKTIKVEPINTGDKIIDTIDGIHGEYFAEFDILYRTYKPYVNPERGAKKAAGKRYLDYFDKTTHLNDKPLLSEDNQLFEYPLGRNRVCFTNGALYAEEVKSNSNLSGVIENEGKRWKLYDTYEGEYSFQRRSLMQQMSAFSVQVTVPGNSEITVGDIVDLDTVIYRTSEQDKYLSGKYLVLAVNHQITTDGYDSIITLGRDSILTDKWETEIVDQ